MVYKIEKMNIFFEEKKYSIKDFSIFVNNYLNKLKNGDKLIVLLDYSPQLIFTIFWCINNGVTFIPIDIRTPKERINLIIEEVEPQFLITQENDYFKIIEYTKNSRTDTLNELSYIIFTSGSTGKPKGVEITVENLNHFLNNFVSIIDLKTISSFLCITSPSFDIFILEAIFPIILEKELFIYKFGDNPRKLSNYIEEKKIECVQLTPSRFEMLANYNNNFKFLRSVKTLLIGGERFPIQYIDNIKAISNLKVYNLYGPTETTIWVTADEVNNNEYQGLKNCIPGNELQVLNDRMEITSVNEIGEIYIVGKSVGNGYYNNKKLTNEKFVKLENKKAFKTGDLGRKNADGSITYIGRNDLQIKIGGKRLELEEIENVARNFLPDGQIIVQVFEVSKNRKQIGIIFEDTGNDKRDDLKAYLNKFLPSYMLPQKYIQIENIPKQISGKADLKQIRDMFSKLETEGTDFVKEEWDKCLSDDIYNSIIDNINLENIESININSNLTDIGIDSISFINIVLSLEAEYNIQFEDEKLLFSEFPKIKDLVEYVYEKK